MNFRHTPILQHCFLLNYSTQQDGISYQEHFHPLHTQILGLVDYCKHSIFYNVCHQRLVHNASTHEAMQKRESTGYL